MVKTSNSETPQLKNLKHVISFRIMNAPLMISSGTFIPTKGEITIFSNRVGVKITGQTGGYGVRSIAYNLYGYHQREAPPKWLIPLVYEAGYTGEIED